MEIAICVVDSAADFFAATKRIILISFFYFVLSLAIIALTVKGCFILTTMNDFPVIYEEDVKVGSRYKIDKAASLGPMEWNTGV